MKIHHIGYLVTDMDAALKCFESLGFSIQRPPMEDLSRNVAICFITDDAAAVELICPLGEDSAVGALARKLKQGPYHICYEVVDVDEAVEKYAGQGFIVTQKPLPAVAIEGRRVAFLYHKDIGIIELLETQ